MVLLITRKLWSHWSFSSPPSPFLPNSLDIEASSPCQVDNTNHKSLIIKITDQSLINH